MSTKRTKVSTIFSRRIWFPCLYPASLGVRMRRSWFQPSRDSKGIFVRGEEHNTTLPCLRLSDFNIYLCYNDVHGRYASITRRQENLTYLIWADGWVNNIMFNHDSSECILVDWTFLQTGSPFADFGSLVLAQ